VTFTEYVLAFPVADADDARGEFIDGVRALIDAKLWPHVTRWAELDSLLHQHGACQHVREVARSLWVDYAKQRAAHVN
jgi:hypothetical protein